MSVFVALCCLNFGVSYAAAVTPSLFERNTVPLLPPATESTRPVREPGAAVEFNPLPFAFGKFGGNVEIALLAHQALILSPAYFSYGNYFHGPEAELGYRLYGGRHALEGPFLGLGAMGALFQYHPDSDCGAGVASCSRADQSTFLYGATLEAGWQWVLKSRLVLSLGAGLVVQHAAPRSRKLYESDFTSVAELVIDSGVRPRGLFSVGFTL